MKGMFEKEVVVSLSLTYAGTIATQMSFPLNVVSAGKSAQVH